jgi:aldehyde:ferredoxin oxidoreductase
MTGPLSGTGAPSSDKFVVVTKSPLTGIMASSSCGGSFGFKLKRAGYDGLIVRGLQNRQFTFLFLMTESILLRQMGFGVLRQQMHKQRLRAIKKVVWLLVQQARI